MSASTTAASFWEKVAGSECGLFCAGTQKIYATYSGNLTKRMLLNLFDQCALAAHEGFCRCISKG